MPLVNTKAMFEKAYREGYAVGAFNVDSLAMCQAVLLAAQECRSPVILAFSKGSREFMHPGNIKDQILAVSKDITIPFAIHLDHGKDKGTCFSCIDEGFTSVMMDASSFAFEENVRLTKEVVVYAHEHNVTVEGELEGHDGDRYSDPQQVAAFVKATGVDSLAVAVGTCHGQVKFRPGEIPALQFDRLEEIKRLLPGFPLVLHGSSAMSEQNIHDFNHYGGNLGETFGIPEELLKKAAKTAVCKINVGTDFRVAYVGALRRSLAENPSHFEPRTFLAPAQKAAQALVEHKLREVFLSANHA